MIGGAPWKQSGTKKLREKGGEWVEDDNLQAWKEVLRNYRALAKELEQIEELIARIEARITEAKTIKMSNSPSPGWTNDTLGAHLARLEMLREMYNKRWDRLIDSRRKIEAAIEPLEPTERMLMRYRYIDGLAWDKVAKKLSYSYRHVTRMHGEILKKMSHYVP